MIERMYEDGGGETNRYCIYIGYYYDRKSAPLVWFVLRDERFQGKYIHTTFDEAIQILRRPNTMQAVARWQL